MSDDGNPPTWQIRRPVAGALLALAILLVYLNGIHGAFLFDDKSSIPNNPSLHQSPWLMGALHPPHNTGDTVDGRPVVNLSLAINYFFGGDAVEGYHAVNIVIHILVALVLFGILRRAFLQVGLAHAEWLAFWTTLLWALHPLDTESVTYMVQRAESLMGLFYLLTLYCFIRGCDGRHGLTWLNLSVAACVLGMGCKEIMVSAPLTVLLYDRAFVSGSLAEAFRRRWPYYGALGASWLVLAALVASTHERGRTSGFALHVSWLDYEESQPMAVLHYLRLAFWPEGLNFDYGMTGLAEWKAALVSVPVVLILGLTAVAGLILNRAWGLLGWIFFAVLAPTSIQPGVRQTLAEHRMYLALIAPVALTVILLSPRLGRWAIPSFAVVAVVLGLLTIRRNRDYSDELTLYRASAATLPDNPYALNNLGVVLMQQGDLDEAAMWYQQALRVQPDNPLPRDNLGAIFIKKGLVDLAITQYRETVRRTPQFAKAYVNLGNGYLMKSLPQAAISAYEDAVALDPGSAVPENGMAIAYERLGAPSEAIAHFQRSIALDPFNPDTYGNLGNTYAKLGRFDEAQREYDLSLHLNPHQANVHYNLGNVLLKEAQFDLAVREYQACVDLDPAFAGARENLGNALVKSGRIEAGLAQLRQAIQVDPRRAGAYLSLAQGLATAGRKPEAIAECEAAIRLDPSLLRARMLLDALATPKKEKGGVR